jgi:hypothetical protein
MFDNNRRVMITVRQKGLRYSLAGARVSQMCICVFASPWCTYGGSGQRRGPGAVGRKDEGRAARGS